MASNHSEVTVAVIGAGPSGLSMLRAFREDGFKTTLFERRAGVGGLWAYTDDKTLTTALPTTKANISKYTCGFSDFPIPDKYPHYLSQANFQEFLEEYACHFDLVKDIVFHTTVKSVVRNADDSKWCVEMDTNGQRKLAEFDKVAFAHGYQTEAMMPTFPGQKKFEGTVTHSQQFRSAVKFSGKTVVVVGLGSTSGDIVPVVAAHAAKVYLSHRRGAVVFKRLGTGTPADLTVTRQRRNISLFLQHWFPKLAIWLANKGTEMLMRKSWGRDGLDPTWRLTPTPCVLLTFPASAEDIVPLLQAGKVTSLHGLKCFTGPSSIEFDDGTVLQDVDSVICCTGYSANFSVAPWLEESTPPNYDGLPLKRLFMNTFPPKYADSICFSNYAAFGKTNGFSFTDVVSIGVSNIWRGVSKLPSVEQMEEAIDAQQRWIASRWRIDKYSAISAVKQWEWQDFFNSAAGTGLENLGWGWKGWAFWMKDRQLSSLMNNGVETAYVFRYFETGKRRVWGGARDAIIRANEAVKVFPVKE